MLKTGEPADNGKGGLVQEHRVQVGVESSTGGMQGAVFSAIEYLRKTERPEARTQ